MDREEIEDLVYASLGRHLRVTCVLGLLFLGIGFVMGHLVAAQHTRVMCERWAAQAEQLSKQVTQVESKLKAELAKVRELTQSPAATPAAVPTAVTQDNTLTPPVIVTDALPSEEPLAVAHEHAAEGEPQCREQVARCIEETEREKARIQSELQPYLDQKLTIQATEVSSAVNRLFDIQMAHLKNLGGDESTVAHAQNAPYFRPSNISPISAESTPVESQSSLVAPLLPVPGDHTSPGEDATLMPLPNTRVARVPVAAEPTHGRSDVLESNFSTPTRPPRRSIFLGGRKPVEVSKNTEAAAQ